MGIMIGSAAIYRAYHIKAIMSGAGSVAIYRAYHIKAIMSGAGSAAIYRAYHIKAIMSGAGSAAIYRAYHIKAIMSGAGSAAIYRAYHIKAIMSGAGSAAIYRAYRPNFNMSAINRRTTNHYFNDNTLVIFGEITFNSQTARRTGILPVRMSRAGSPTYSSQPGRLIYESSAYNPKTLSRQAIKVTSGLSLNLSKLVRTCKLDLLKSKG